MGKPPLCLSCARWTYQQIRTAGIVDVDAACEHDHRHFPRARSCKDYVYEPGSDPDWRETA